MLPVSGNWQLKTAGRPLVVAHELAEVAVVDVRQLAAVGALREEEVPAPLLASVLPAAGA